MKLRLLLLFSLCLKIALGQTNEQVELLQKSPASPNTASLLKYVEFPVNMSTGIPEIQIPIYTVKSGNIQIPITLSYHAGGVKVDDFSGKVGMNWTLNVGGSISRKINGLDDFYGGSNGQITYGIYNDPRISWYYPEFNTVEDIVHAFGIMQPDSLELVLGRIAQGRIDGEADEFVFSLPSGSGKFFFNQTTQQYQFDKLQGWTIEYSNNYGTTDTSWNITTNHGITYKFKHVEWIKNPLLLRGGVSDVQNYYLPNAWHLSEVYDNSTGRTVSFDYYKLWKWRHVGWDIFWNFELQYGFNAGQQNEHLEREGHEYFVNHIYTDKETVEFIEDTVPRDDEGIKAIKEIRVTSNGAVVKRVLFNYFYDTSRLANNQLDPSSKITFLESIQEVIINGSDTAIQPPYKFVYNFDNHLPKRLSYAQDHYGFYNGRISNTTLVPKDVLQSYGVIGAPYGADRSIDTTFTKAGIIREIYYPTGGKSVFIFENHRAYGEIVGGLRIKNIRYIENITGLSVSTDYLYVDSLNRETGIRLFSPVNSYEFYHNNGGYGYWVVQVLGQSKHPLFSYKGSPIAYAYVQKRIVSTYDTLVSNHYFNIPQVLDGGAGVPFPKVTIDDGGGYEVQSVIYRHNANNTYSKVRQTVNNYTLLNEYRKYITNVQAAFVQRLAGAFVYWPQNDPYTTFPLNMAVYTNTYKLFSESWVNKVAQNIDYTSTGPIITNQFFEYDTLNSNIKVTKTLNSKGDTLIQVNRYKNDFAIFSSSLNEWNSSIADLAVSSPVEIITYYKKANSNDTSLVSAVLFQHENNNIKKVFKARISSDITNFIPAYNTVNKFYFDKRYVLEQEVVSFTNFYKPRTVDNLGKIQAYVWDSSANDLIAIVVNASAEDIAYTSFEDVSKGYWSFTGSSVNDPTSPTGDKVYSINTGGISKSGLGTSKKYVVSYWSKSGTVMVNGSSADKTGNTVTGWTYYEHHLSNVNNIAIAGTGYIDELRLYPRDALMTTYTYHPAFGITSECDINNKISYYEYDFFGRLKKVRDQYRNIIKIIEYQYQVPIQ